MSNYLIFIDIVLYLSEELPAYSNKYSRKDYTQRQLFVLFLLKQKSKLSYDNFVDDFFTRDSAIKKLGLRRVPRASTLKMFIKRISCQTLELILGFCINLTRGGKMNTAVDATGFQLEDGSYSYLKRLGLSTKKRKNLKLSVFIDTSKHLFLAVKPRKGDAHDNRDFKPLVNKTLRNTERERLELILLIKVMIVRIIMNLLN